MSMLDNITDEALLGDVDELDYDLEKDEEDALLADPDNYDDNNYEDVHDETVDEQYDGQGGAEEESDVLDIDVNVALEETEEDINDQSCVKQENFEVCKTEVEDCPSDPEHEEQKARDRFLNERNNVIKRSNSSGIPDTLDKVNVKPPPLLDNRNIKFQRGNRGRGRGRPNHGRGSVFGRMGTLPQEGKTVLINPHFRGNVQVNENARLVWDANNPNGHYQQQQPQPQRGYGNPQMAHVAPFQSQFNQNPPSPWVNPPFAVDTANNNNGGSGNFGSSPMHHHQGHQNFPEAPANYGPLPELMNNGIRPLLGSNHVPFNQQHHQHNPPQQQQQQQQQQQMTSWNEDQSYGAEPVYPAQVGNFRGREVRYIQPLLPAPTFNQQPPLQQSHFQQHGRNNFNNTFNNDTNHPPPQQQQTPPRRHVKPYINPNHPQAPPMVPQTNYHQAHFDQPPPYIQQQQQQQQFPANHPPYQAHNQQQPPAQPAFNQPPVYDSYSNHGFNNQYPNHQFQPQPAGMQANQSQSNNGFPPANNYQQHGFENNFANSQQSGGQFNQQQPPQHYNNSNRHPFGQNNRMQHQQQQHQQQQQQRQNNRQQMNNYNNTPVNRSPPKRRSFDNQQGVGDRDGPKKKMRSMEPSNLHEVPTVDMPDTTTEDKTESEDEETKAYRLKIEEQKKKREEFLRAKEQRRKMAAAQRAEGGGESLLGDAPAPDTSGDISSAPVSTVKPKPLIAATVKQPQQQPLLKQPVLQQAQSVVRQQQRVRPQGQQQGLIQLPPHLQQQQGFKQQAFRQQAPQQQQQGFKQQTFRQQGPQQQQQQQRPLQRVNTQQQQQGVRRIPVQQQQRVNNQQRNNLRNVPQQQPRRVVQPANIVVTQKNEQQQQRVVLLKQPPPQQQQRRVVLKGVQQQQQQDGSEQENLSSFLSNRKVVTNSSVLAGGDVVSGGVSMGGGGAGVSVGGGGTTAGVGVGGAAALIETPVVVVSNLAAGTTDVKIRKLCQGLGPIQNIELIPNSRQATIRFKNIVSAHKFFKKYQRKIVDLSMIQVCLVAES